MDDIVDWFEPDPEIEDISHIFPPGPEIYIDEHEKQFFVDTFLNFLGVKSPEIEIWKEFCPKGMEKLYGTPGSDMEVWHLQERPDSCAIASQEFILDTLTGHDHKESDLVKDAMEKGYYHPGRGTMPYDVGRLLEDHGFKVFRSEFNTIEDIKEALARGQKIIVGLDANEIWANSGREQLKDLLFMPQANHAVVVIGYDEQTQEIILNDPGHPDGQGMRVALTDFLYAWEDSNCFMVATIDPSQSTQA